MPGGRLGRIDPATVLDHLNQHLEKKEQDVA